MGAAALVAMIGIQVFQPDLLPGVLRPKPRPQIVEAKAPAAAPVASAQYVAVLQKDGGHLLPVEGQRGLVNVMGRHVRIGGTGESGRADVLPSDARARRDQVRATGRAIASIDRLFEASGATALGNDQPVQRFWRDAHAGRVHAANDPERAYQIFGNNEFGLPPGDTMV